MTRSDAELLRAHLGGERGAFVELVERYQGLLWTVALRWTSNRADADEAVQDALLRAHQAASTCAATGSLRPWLLTILINACRDRYRRDRARPVEPAPVEQFELIAAPDDPIAAWLDRDELVRALAELPPEQQRVVALVEWCGLPVAEVAALLGVAEGTVKSRNWRARLRLRALLAPDPGPGPGPGSGPTLPAPRTEAQWTS